MQAERGLEALLARKKKSDTGSGDLVSGLEYRENCELPAVIQRKHEPDPLTINPS